MLLQILSFQQNNSFICAMEAYKDFCVVECGLSKQGMEEGSGNSGHVELKIIEKHNQLYIVRSSSISELPKSDRISVPTQYIVQFQQKILNSTQTLLYVKHFISHRTLFYYIHLFYGYTVPFYMTVFFFQFSGSY